MKPMVFPGRRSVWSEMILLSVLLAAAGCDGTGGDRVDLVEAWDRALVATETALIDIGTPEGRHHLGPGWYHDEIDRGAEETFVWSRGERSEIGFHLGWRRDLEIQIRCRPFRFPDASPQRMSLVLNGTPLATLEITPGMSDYTITAPADAQLVGHNRLFARYGRVDSPIDVTPGSSDRRDLAVAWSEVEFYPVDGTPLNANSGFVTLPAGSHSDHFLNLGANGVVEILRCVPTAAGPMSLELSVLGEGEERERISAIPCSEEAASVRLDNRPGLTRVRFSVIPGGDGVGPGGVVLEAPVVRWRRQPAETPTVAPPASGGEFFLSRPNVVIYLVDALRADRLGLYGCERGLSPRLDAMARDGVTFTNTIAQSSWTKAAVASIFTGLWPRAHGVNGPDDKLPEGLTTLPELFRSAGYRSGAVVANAYVGRPFGFARGFDHFELIEHTRGRSPVIHDRLESWLSTVVDDDRPFMLYVHTIDPHAPYAPPRSFRERFAPEVEDPSVGEVDTVRGLVLGTVEPNDALGRDLRALYDAEVAANDHSFGRLLDLLEELGELEETIVVFTSDHGEAFGEHGTWTHGLDLYDEVLAIPLVIRLPGGRGAGQLVSSPVQHIDLLPTLLHLTGIDRQEELPGSILVDAAGRVVVRSDRTLFGYLDYWDRKGATAIRDGWKLIQPLSSEFSIGVELFRRSEDPGETTNLAGLNPVRSGWLEAQLGVALRITGTSQSARVDHSTREQLKALGYIE
jgi:arylsulfatase A-like enzyme